ncbi:MAG: transcription antitermination factor NusB [Patescibacteria group bacterium]
MDTRHQKRTEIVQDLFAYSFKQDLQNLPYAASTTQDIIRHIPAIDAMISSLAIKFPIDKIAKIDLSILRLAVYELSINKIQPQKVVINEAIELAKELGGDKSYSFINGVLGKLMKKDET